MHLDLDRQEEISLMGSAVLMLLINKVQASNLVDIAELKDFSRPLFPVFKPGTLISLKSSLFSKSFLLTSETYPIKCEEDPSFKYFLATATTGFIP